MENETNQIFVQFRTPEGVISGPPVGIDADSSIRQLEILLNQLLGNEEPLPYSFAVGEQEINSTIQQDILDSAQKTFEDIISIVYRPQAVFRVRAVTRCTSTLSGHAGAILVISFSPDGQRLATGSGDNTVRFWDLNTETPLTVGTGHTNWILALSWSPDGKYLASGSMDGSIRIWDGNSGIQVGRPLISHSKWITALCWEPLHLASPAHRLVSASRDGTAKIWDIKRSVCVATLSQHTDAVTCLRWAGDGSIYTGSRDRSIRRWNSNDGSLMGKFDGHAHWINSMALSTDFVLRTGAFDHNGEAPKDPDVARLEALKRYELAKGAVPERLVSGSDDFTMFLWTPTVNSKPIARLIGHQQLVNQVAFSPDGRYIASASFDKSTKLWNGENGKFISSLRGHVGPVYQVTWSADSRLLATVSRDSTAKIWDPRSRESALKVELPGHQDEVYAIDWSPTGDRLATGGKDKTLKLWRQ